MTDIKINATGVIAEFNPFHNGHKYLVAKTKEETGDAPVVAVMSGSFTQRGEIAVSDKYSRTKMALLSGVDLVVELPTMFITAGAESFAAGAVSIIKAMGLKNIAFGSESGELDKMRTHAKMLAEEPPEFKEALKRGLKEGLSFAKARSLACGINKKQGSNDILATEYLKQMIIQGADIEPVCINRMGGEHRDGRVPNMGEYASATAIRKNIELMIEPDNPKFSRFVPAETRAVFEEIAPSFKPELNDCYTALRIKLLTMSEEELEGILGAGEGVTNKLRAELRNAFIVDILTERVLSKRYTESRINRLYLNILMSLKKSDYRELADAYLSGESRYARVLGFTKRGAEILRRIKDERAHEIRIITNINKEAELLDERALRILYYDILSNDILNMTTGRMLDECSDYVRKPIIV